MTDAENSPPTSTSIKLSLANFYRDNHPLFEITGILLVFTGLLLNITIEEGFAGQSMKLLQFFSIIGTALALSTLVAETVEILTTPLQNWADQVQKENPNSFSRILRALVIMMIPLATIFFFLVALLTYLVLSFTKEIIFILCVSMCLGVAYALTKVSEMEDFFHAIFYLTVISILCVIFPICLFVVILLPELPHSIMAQWIEARVELQSTILRIIGHH